MVRDRQGTSTFFIRLASGFGWKQPVVKVPSLSCTTNQPQYDLSRHFQSNVNLSHPLFAVFELPDELILSILFYISPEPQIAAQYARFRTQYRMEANDDHRRRVQFLRPLSMTCKAMRFRFMPWMWNLIELSSLRGDYSVSLAIYLANLTIITNVTRVDTSLATSVKYLRALCPWTEANSCPPKVHDVVSPASLSHRFVRRLPKVPSKSTHARDRVGRWHVVSTALSRAGAWEHKIPPD